eukprot:355158-Chlamydomonas_euryale.AAC.10
MCGMCVWVREDHSCEWNESRALLPALQNVLNVWVRDEVEGARVQVTCCAKCVGAEHGEGVVQFG